MNLITSRLEWQAGRVDHHAEGVTLPLLMAAESGWLFDQL
jgi:hypothetical protein